MRLDVITAICWLLIVCSAFSPTMHCHEDCSGVSRDTINVCALVLKHWVGCPNKATHSSMTVKVCCINTFSIFFIHVMTDVHLRFTQDHYNAHFRGR